MGGPELVLDETVAAGTAEAARDLGLEVKSVHELGIAGADDGWQLVEAARRGATFVTYNRADYIDLTRRFFHEHRDHAGVLIVPGSFRRSEPVALARALEGWTRTITERLGNGKALPPYTIEFLPERPAA